MHYIIDILNESEVNKLKTYFDFTIFEEGLWGGKEIQKTIKNNLETIADKQRQQHEIIIEQALKRNKDFVELIHPDLLSIINFGRYTKGMYYNYHNDNPFMMAMDRKTKIRTDYSCTLFLSEPTDYEGGELVLNIGNTEQSFKLKPGQGIFYPTDYLHKVNQVTEGTRDVAVFWVQSKITDRVINAIMGDFHYIHKEYHNKMQGDEYHDLLNRLGHIKYQLLRHFSSTYTINN